MLIILYNISLNCVILQLTLNVTLLLCCKLYCSCVPGSVYLVHASATSVVHTSISYFSIIPFGSMGGSQRRWIVVELCRRESGQDKYC